MRNIKIWFRAVFLRYPYYRVTYKDGRQTYGLEYEEAKGLAGCFDGKIWIDYNITRFDNL